jgi:monovalent cation/hydrogen antiporter
MKTTQRLADAAWRVAFQGSPRRRDCAHLGVTPSFPGAATCPSCEAAGSSWVALRMCLTCGSVGCCDSSTGRHARSHFEATGHPVMRSIQGTERWAWCYADEAYLPLAS